jgi:hypothetical protein
MPFLKEGEIRRRKKCSEHLKELDSNVGETEVDQTDANPGTDYKDICWQDRRRIVELKTLAEQLNACDGCDTPLNLMNIEPTSVSPTFLSNSFKCSEHFFPTAYFSFF